MKRLIKFLSALTLGLAVTAPIAYAATKPAASSQVMPNVYKVRVAKGVSIDDAIQSMKLRANALNIKLVAELPLSKQVEAITDQPQRHMTIFQFCDALTAKELVDASIDFAIFLPCRIALIEDKNGQAWLVMMDMNVAQLGRAAKLDKALVQKMTTVRNGLIEIINAGAKGEL